MLDTEHGIQLAVTKFVASKDLEALQALRGSVTLRTQRVREIVAEGYALMGEWQRAAAIMLQPSIASSVIAKPPSLHPLVWVAILRTGNWQRCMTLCAERQFGDQVCFDMISSMIMGARALAAPEKGCPSTSEFDRNERFTLWHHAVRAFSALLFHPFSRAWELKWFESMCVLVLHANDQSLTHTCTWRTVMDAYIRLRLLREETAILPKVTSYVVSQCPRSMSDVLLERCHHVYDTTTLNALLNSCRRQQLWAQSLIDFTRGESQWGVAPNQTTLRLLRTCLRDYASTLPVRDAQRVRNLEHELLKYMFREHRLVPQRG